MQMAYLEWKQYDIYDSHGMLSLQTISGSFARIQRPLIIPRR